MLTNNLQKSDKELVEEIPFGKIGLTIRDGYPNWNDEMRNALLGEIVILINSSESMNIGACSALRFVVVTGKFPDEVLRWGHLLNEVWRTTSEGAVGQTLTWGDGKVSSTYSVIILPQEIALMLIAGEAKDKDTALGVLVHELAHVHDNVMFLNLLGVEPVPKMGDWTSVRRFFARSLWGEYFAESISCQYTIVNDANENIAHSIILLRDVIQQVQDETLAYQTHQTAGKVWAVAMSSLSPFLNHIGRSLAILLVSEQATKELDRFLEDVNLISSQWREVVQKIANVLIDSDNLLNPIILDQLCEQVDNCFRLVGLEPYENA